MRYALSTGKESSKPAGSALLANQPRAGWMKMASANKATIIGSENLDKRLMKK